MKLIGVLCLLFLSAACLGQSDHQQCAENRDSVMSPLRGWVGMTNTGQPVAGMTIECFASRNKPPIATVKTDAAGRFAFPTVGPGKYYLKGTKRLNAKWVVVTDKFVTVSKGAKGIACLVAEGEESKPLPR